MLIRKSVTGITVSPSQCVIPINWLYYVLMWHALRHN